MEMLNFLLICMYNVHFTKILMNFCNIRFNVLFNIMYNVMFHTNINEDLCWNLVDFLKVKIVNLAPFLC